MSPLTLYVLSAVFCAVALTATGQLTLDQLNAEVADLKNRFNNFNQIVDSFCAVALPTTGEMTLDQLNVEFADLNKVFDNFDQNDDSLCKCVEGNVYTRWGKTNCPNGTETLYSGTLGGSWYESIGGSANHLCMPINPVYENHENPELTNLLYGGKYKTDEEETDNLITPCSVCRTTRPSVVTIPAANTCPTGWTLEYAGYLMAGYEDHGSATEFICVDSSFDFLPRTQYYVGERLLYYTVSQCGSLACPPYINHRITVCVVCSK